MSNKKKIVVMSALVLLLAVTAVFNFVLANTNALASAEGGEHDQLHRLTGRGFRRGIIRGLGIVGSVGGRFRLGAAGGEGEGQAQGQ